MINEQNYDGIDFPLSQKHYNKVKKQNSIRINVFGYENGQLFPIHISKETTEDQMNPLLITKDEKKHYVLIKDFIRWCSISMRAGPASCNLIGRKPVLVWICRSSYIPIRRLASSSFNTGKI